MTCCNEVFVLQTVFTSWCCNPDNIIVVKGRGQQASIVMLRQHSNACWRLTAVTAIKDSGHTAMSCELGKRHSLFTIQNSSVSSRPS